jgi:hypothetical protein
MTRIHIGNILPELERFDLGRLIAINTQYHDLRTVEFIRRTFSLSYVDWIHSDGKWNKVTLSYMF